MITNRVLMITMTLVAFTIVAVAIRDRIQCVDCTETGLFAERWAIYVTGMISLILGSIALRRKHP